MCYNKLFQIVQLLLPMWTMLFVFHPVDSFDQDDLPPLLTDRVLLNKLSTSSSYIYLKVGLTDNIVHARSSIMLRNSNTNNNDIIMLIIIILTTRNVTYFIVLNMWLLVNLLSNMKVTLTPTVPRVGV